MKLNLDCIRDILLVLEEHASFGEYVNFESATDYEQTKKYSNEEVGYHIKQCELSGLLYDVNWDMLGNCSIRDLSPQGHEFLANIRADNNWNKVKKTAIEVGSNSLSAITQIATSVISGIISAKLGN